MAKRYKCPYCELRDERKKLIAHIDKRHEEMLPEGYDGARTVYDMINHTNGHGTCRICKKDTQWNMSSQRYDVLCGNPKCKEAMREEYKKNMIRVKGTYNILNDPEQQQKMLANRKISGKYRYSDGTIFTYTGSYEKKLLEFEDAVMNIPSNDILMPGPTIEYMYNGKKHFYIADQLYIPYNLIIEIKDGGDNKNGKETPGMIASREKTIEKEKVITDKGEYNYLRLTNNDFVQLIEIFMELKDHYLTGDDSKIVRVHEAYAKNENDIYYNKDKFDSGEINLCFITGHSGSGKSTMGRDLQSDSIEHYELDDLQCIKDHFTMENLKEYGDLIYSYFSGKGKKFYLTKKEIVDNKIPGSKYEDILYKDFVHYAMNYAKSHKNKKYIIEGVWLLCSGEDGKYWFDPEEFKDYAFYIKGTSMIISKHRAALRDAKTDNDNKIGVTKAYLNNFIRKNWKWYFIDENRINRFRKYFKELDTVINESCINESEEYNYNQKTTDIIKDEIGDDISIISGDIFDSEITHHIENFEKSQYEAMLESENIVRDYNNFIQLKIENLIKTKRTNNNVAIFDTFLVFYNTSIEEYNKQKNDPEVVKELENLGIKSENDLKKYIIGEFTHKPSENPKIIKQLLEMRLKYVNTTISLLKNMVSNNAKILGLTSKELEDIMKISDVKDVNKLKEIFLKNENKFVKNRYCIDMRSIGAGMVITGKEFEIDSENIHTNIGNFLQDLVHYDLIVVAHGDDQEIKRKSDSYDNSKGVESIDKTPIEIYEEIEDAIYKKYDEDQARMFLKCFKKVYNKNRVYIDYEMFPSISKLQKIISDDNINLDSDSVNKMSKDAESIYKKYIEKYKNKYTYSSSNMVSEGNKWTFAYPIQYNGKTYKEVEKLIKDAKANGCKKIKLYSCNPGHYKLSKELEDGVVYSKTCVYIESGRIINKSDYEDNTDLFELYLLENSLIKYAEENNIDYYNNTYLEAATYDMLNGIEYLNEGITGNILDKLLSFIAKIIATIINLVKKLIECIKNFFNIIADKIKIRKHGKISKKIKFKYAILEDAKVVDAEADSQEDIKKAVTKSCKTISKELRARSDLQLKIINDIKKQVEQLKFKYKVNESNYYLPAINSCLKVPSDIKNHHGILVINNNQTVNESTKSTIDANYKPKGKKNLSSFKKVHITESIINKYKKEYPFLSHVRCKDTKDYICDGYIWFDNDELVAMVGSCEYTDDKTKWVVSLEITNKYKGYGLSKQILDYAVKTMNCKYLSVNKNNAVAKKIYDEYGFKVYQEDKTMYYMTIDKNIKESLYSSSSDSESSIIESKSLEFKELLKTINTPKELSNWMKTNIHYKEYDRLMTANEVFDKKKGSCHDQVNFEVEFFKKFNLKYGKEFLIEYNEGETSGGRTHSFIWFTTKGKYYWFENAWNDEQGIHGPYDSIIDIKKEVKEKMLKGSRFNNIEFSSVKNIKPGMTLDEFVTACLESTIMESMKNNNKLYFLSTINMNDDRLTPRIPSNYFTKNNYEENKTPRVCFAKTIDGCLMGLSKNLTDKEFYVHVPDPDGYYNVYNPTIKEVPDCKITGEVWIKKPVDLKCIGKIKVLKDTGEAGIPFKYGDKTAELYKWDWKWVDKYDDESINESLEIRLTTNIFEKEITIYHGSPFKTSVIYPLSFNAGTKLSKPRMSSFWADEHTAKLFGIYRLIQNNDFIISFTPDLNGLLVKPSDYNSIIKLLKSENIYLYEKTLDKKYVGIGHSNYFDEYTVDYPVRPDKIYVLGYNDLKAEINSINTYNTNDNEKIYKITEKNLNIMLKMNNGIMRKIIANDFQYFKDKSKEYRKGQLVTANNESFIDPKVVEIANYINENFIFNEDYFNVKMEPINNNTYLIAEYIIGKNSLDMKKLSDSFSMLKERCNTDQYGLCMIKDSNNNKYNLYLTDISAFKESVLKGPKKCPKCGGKVGVFIEGEPIYKCIKCGKFLGVVPCHLGKKKK